MIKSYDVEFLYGMITVYVLVEYKDGSTEQVKVNILP